MGIEIEYPSGYASPGEILYFVAQALLKCLNYTYSINSVCQLKQNMKGYSLNSMKTLNKPSSISLIFSS